MENDYQLCKWVLHCYAKTKSPQMLLKLKEKYIDLKKDFYST